MSFVNKNIVYNLSNYNVLLEHENESYIYNYISGGFGKLTKQLGDKIKNEYKNNIMQTEIENEEFLEELKKGEMIHIENFNELDYLKAIHFSSRFANKNSFGVTIAPTMACNFRCSYCFEKNNNYPLVTMNEDIINKTITYLKDKMPTNGVMTLSWFGGEPLVAFDVVEKIQTQLINSAKANNTRLLSSMITNGYLLSKDTCDKMIDLGISSVQVTIDGPEFIHNKFRPLANGDGTFNTILNNIINADEKMTISLRINVTKNNISFMDEFLDTLKQYKINTKRNISIYFSLVKDFSSNSCNSCPSDYFSIEQYADEEIKLYELLMVKGFLMTKRIRPMLSSCGAVSPNSILIEPDGGLQSCWNCVGDKDKRVGSLNEESKDQTDFFFNNKIKWLSWTPFEDENCLKCKTLPTCMNGCPYYSIYAPESKYKYNCNSLKFNIENTLKLVLKDNLRANQ